MVGYSAEIPRGLGGEMFLDIGPSHKPGCIDLILTRDMLDDTLDDDRYLMLTHDEARQVIAGLASVIE